MKSYKQIRAAVLATESLRKAADEVVCISDTQDGSLIDEARDIHVRIFELIMRLDRILMS
jgi:hypothetical protein